MSRSIMATPPKKPTRERASTIAYAAGRRAFRDGVLIDENPYPDNRAHQAARKSWFDGWLDKRTENNVGHILEKYPE